MQETVQNKIQAALDGAGVIGLAEFLLSFKPKEQADILHNLDADTRAGVFACLSKEVQLQCKAYLHPADLLNIVQHLPADDASVFLSALPIWEANAFLQKLNKITREQISSRMLLDMQSVGAYMRMEFIQLSPTQSVEEALAMASNNKKHMPIYTCYVCEGNTLVGVVSLKDLLCADTKCTVAAIMRKKFFYLQVHESWERAIQLFQNYGMLTLPVVDKELRILGVLRFAEALKAMQNIEKSHMHKMAGIVPSHSSYTSKSVWEHGKHRILGLLLMLILSGISGLILYTYRAPLLKEHILLAFVPLLLLAASSASLQSGTLLLRAFATGELRFWEWPKALFTELRVSALLGAVLAGLLSLFLFLHTHSIALALLAGASYLLCVVLCAVATSLLTCLLYRRKIDSYYLPLPFLSICCYPIALLLYLYIAGLLLG